MGSQVCAYADEWAVAPYFGVRGEYDDNIRLTTVGQDSVWGTTMTPGMEVDRATTGSQTSVKGFLDITKYSKDVNLDRTDQFLNIDYRADVTEKDRARFAARYKGDSLLRDILIDQGAIELDADPEDTDTGTVAIRVRRRRLTLDPYWQHGWTRRTTISARYRYTDVSYNNTLNTGLTGYRQHSVSISLGLKSSERTTISPSILVSKYQPDIGEFDTNNYTVSIAARRAVAEKISTSLSAGYRQTDVEGLRGTDSSNGVVLDAEVMRRTERDVIVSSVRREVIPSSIGSSRITNQLNLRWTRKLSALQTVVIQARAFRNEALNASNSDRTYINIIPRYKWKLSRHWSVDAAYRYRWQKRENTNNAAVSNALYLGVGYYRKNIY